MCGKRKRHSHCSCFFVLCLLPLCETYHQWFYVRKGLCCAVCCVGFGFLSLLTDVISLPFLKRVNYVCSSWVAWKEISIVSSHIFTWVIFESGHFNFNIICINAFFSSFTHHCFLLSLWLNIITRFRECGRKCE